MSWQMLICIASARIARFNFSSTRKASGLMLTYGNDVNAATAQAA